MATVSDYVNLFNPSYTPWKQITSQSEKALVVVDRARNQIAKPIELRVSTDVVQKQLKVMSRYSPSLPLKATINNEHFKKQASGMRKKFSRIIIDAEYEVIKPEAEDMKKVQGINETRPTKLTAATNKAGTGQQSAKQENDPKKDEEKKKEGAFSGWMKKVKGSVAGFLSVDNLVKGLEVTDGFLNTNARLDYMNDGTHSTEDMQSKIFAAADRSRGSYTAMAGTVGQLGLSAGEAFSGNDEIIGFAELMQKAFRIGGTAPAEQQAGIQQLTGSLGSGGLKGGDFDSLMVSAPLLAEKMAEFSGKSMTEMKAMAAEGAITADVIKGAMFAASDEINERFQAMPRTFSEISSTFQNFALQAAGPAMEKLGAALNEAFNSGTAQELIAFLGNGLGALADIAVWVGQLIADNLDIVKNVLLVVGIAALIAGAQMLAAWIAAAWPVLLVIGLITALISALNYFGISTGEIVGFVAGTFMLMLATIGNSVGLIWNFLLSLIESVANLIKDPIYSVKKLFYDLAMAVGEHLYEMLLGVEEFAGGFMKLINQAVNFGLGKIYDLIDVFNGFFREGKKVDRKLLDEENIHALSDSVRFYLDNLEKPTSDKDVFDFSGAKMDQLDYKDMFEKGFNAGEGLFDSTMGAFDQMTNFPGLGDPPVFPGNDNSSFMNQPGMNNQQAGLIPEIGKVGEVGKINESVDISSEDLKTMRELAEMKNIQNFVTLQPQLTFGDTNIRQEGRSISEIVTNITGLLEQEMTSSARGVYNV
jgi:tape measure domain-containing protein